MSLEVTYTIEIGTISSKTDFTDRVAGFSLSQPLAIMAPSSHKATITLLNYDGALTPSEGGGDGTYADVDWFSQAIFIEAQVNSGNDAVLFHGLITDFDLFDDGTTSTVTLQAIDAVSFLGRAAIDTSSSTYGFLTSLIAEATRSQNLLPVGSILPALGETGSDIRDIIVTGPPYYTEAELDGGAINGDQTIADALTTQIMASGFSLLWATRIDEYFPNYATYHEISVGQSLTRQEETGALAYATAQHFDLVETSPASGELAFVDLELGYNVENLRNYAIVTSASTTNTSTASNSTSIAKYGSQSLTLTSVLLGEDADVAQHAANITNRMGVTRFIPKTVTISTAALADNPSGSAAKLGHLLDSGGGLWQTVSVTYTPTGAASSVTTQCIISGRKIKATPADTKLVLELLPAADYQSFVLDSDVLGVLDQNRLG